jgi:hypothetical protein
MRMPHSNMSEMRTTPDVPWSGIDRPRTYHASHAGEWIVLALFAVMPIATGLDIWFQMGWASPVGRALCLGLVLVAAAWGWAFHAGRIAMRTLVYREGLAVVHGPWRWYLPWADVKRLLERSQVVDGRRVRWVVAEARDGRRLQVRDDRVADYERFRADVNAVYQAWRDQANDSEARWATWSQRHFAARELPGPTRWLRYVAVAITVVGVYLVSQVPQAVAFGALLIAVGMFSGAARASEWLRQQTVVVDAQGVEAHRRLRSRRLRWETVTRVERRHHPLSPFVVVPAAIAHALRTLVRRPNSWTAGSRWVSHAPEDLLFRGGGRQIRVRLHRVEDPGEFVEATDLFMRIAQRRATATSSPTAATARPTRRFVEPPADVQPPLPDEPPIPYDDRPSRDGRGSVRPRTIMERPEVPGELP